MRPVYAIILAAGESRRFAPKNKLFLPWGDDTILEAAVKNVLASRVDGTVVVLGHQAKRAATLLENLSCRTVVNPDYPAGMGTSVVAGIDFWLRHADIGPEAGLLFALGDQPFIPSAVMDTVIRNYRETSAGIVVPVYRGRHGHPSIFHRRYADEIREVAGRWGAREVLRRHPEDILRVKVETESVVLDIDTPEDYELFPIP
ncbi:MAG: nucleotidyltransferase family protein [Candidatus Euphemobacter frigidus]|nr:nucleotidyltransferase family protein [Candidatus Euphemobacter frigidus]MDP8275784.1 nucleotidyltransferase family protein [Candidatus Euphemobacter frigidus]